MKLLVLAGGFGTRLRSAVPDLPKALAPVGDRPFLGYLIESWREQGINEFVFLLHYKADQIEDFIAETSLEPEYLHAKFTTILEPKPLGTGGSIRHAIKRLSINENFLVANADTWLGSGIKIISETPPCSIMAVKVKNTSRYGALRFDGSQLARFEEKSSPSGHGYVNSGLYHLSPGVFEGLDLNDRFSLEQDVFPKLALAGLLRAVRIHTSFIDIGVPQDYLRFCRAAVGGSLDDL